MPSPAASDDTRGLLAAPAAPIERPAAPIEAPRPTASQRKLEAQTVSRVAHQGPDLVGQDLAAALARVAQGDRAALALLYGASSVKLYGIVQRILRRQDLADAVLEDVYVRVWQRAGDFDGTGGSPGAWLATLARNLALDDIRGRASGSLADLPGSFRQPGAVGSASQSEALRRLSACLNALPSEGREIVLLAYHYGLTREQISESVGRPAARIKSSLRQSLAQLKDCLG
jgi:RNA polymerase sigma-70 factor, ECF subfamily